MGLLSAIGFLLPLGVAGAFSAIPIAAAIVILSSDRARRNGLAYLVGLTAALFIVAFALSFGISALPSGSSPLRAMLLAVGAIVLGVLLITYGLVVFLRRPAGPREGGGWLGALDRAPAWTTLGTGVAMSIRPKALLLAVAVGVAVAKSDLTPGDTLIAVGVFAVLSVSTVAVPVVFTVVAPERAKRWLSAGKDFLARHGRGLTLIVSVLIGVVLVGDGLARL